MSQTDISSAVELIRNPERMNRSTVDLIKRAIELYPYHQALYLLLLQNMYKIHDQQFGEMLKKYAVMVADRSVLFDMVEGINYMIPNHAIDSDAETTPKDGDRTLALIDSFLHSLPETPQSVASSPSAAADSSADYSAYLEALPDISSSNSSANPEQSDGAQKAGATLSANTTDDINIFVGSKGFANNSKDTVGNSKGSEQSKETEDEFTVEAIRNSLAKTGGSPLEEDDSPLDETDSGTPESEYFTETMAGIYIKQQKYQQALEIIRVLSAANPKKSVYFADQIRYLKLLIKLKNTKEQ